MDRLESKLIAVDTLDCILREGYKTQGRFVSLQEDLMIMRERTKLYRSEPLYITRDFNEDKANITFSNRSTVAATKNFYKHFADKHYKVGLLNFASATRPGGGFLNGAMAQEESIAKVSTLYASLVDKNEFYFHNRALKNPLYSDYIIYSERVSFFKEEDGSYENEYYTADVITSPAPNKRELLKTKNKDVAKVYNTMKNRIRKILTIAILNNIDCLVLGAFGCGVFGNDIKEVAGIFHDILVKENFEYFFREIEFAIYDKNPETVEIFKKNFK